jgi:hypothetical protein
MPKSVELEDDEVDLINRAMVAIELKKFPSEVDDQPAEDVWAVMAVMNERVKIRNSKP